VKKRGGISEGKRNEERGGGRTETRSWWPEIEKLSLLVVVGVVSDLLLVEGLELGRRGGGVLLKSGWKKERRKKLARDFRRVLLSSLPTPLLRTPPQNSTRKNSPCRPAQYFPGTSPAFPFLSASFLE